MKRLLLTIMFCISLLALVSAGPSFTFQQGTPVDLKVSCLDENTTFCKSTTTCTLTINRPDMNNLVKNVSMSNSEEYYNYTLDSVQTGMIGEHSAAVYCVDGERGGYSPFTYLITESGSVDEGLSRVQIFFIFFLFAYGLILLGFSIENHTILVLGSMLLTSLCIYFFVYDIGSFGMNSTYIKMFAFINLAVGFYLLSKASIEFIQENV